MKPELRLLLQHATSRGEHNDSATYPRAKELRIETPSEPNEKYLRLMEELRVSLDWLVNPETPFNGEEACDHILRLASSACDLKRAKYEMYLPGSIAVYMPQEDLITYATWPVKCGKTSLCWSKWVEDKLSFPIVVGLHMPTITSRRTASPEGAWKYLIALPHGDEAILERANNLDLNRPVNQFKVGIFPDGRSLVSTILPKLE